ncbi:hypothetical protein [Niallia sp. FSL R7-0271]|uniref:hypothetical protein n=1 Tax=Niallia sp. FSL R7-0271 TaxID=2921678 RepID=UPI0030F8FCA4
MKYYCSMFPEDFLEVDKSDSGDDSIYIGCKVCEEETGYFVNLELDKAEELADLIKSIVSEIRKGGRT